MKTPSSKDSKDEIPVGSIVMGVLVSACVGAFVGMMVDMALHHKPVRRYVDHDSYYRSSVSTSTPAQKIWAVTIGALCGPLAVGVVGGLIYLGSLCGIFGPSEKSLSQLNIRRGKKGGFAFDNPCCRGEIRIRPSKALFVLSNPQCECPRCGWSIDLMEEFGDQWEDFRTREFARRAQQDRDNPGL